MHYYIKMLKNYVNFSGLATRKEFWFAILLNSVVYTLLLAIYFISANIYAIMTVIYFFATIIPVLSLTIRRLHDVDRSGFNLLWILVPFAGWIILVIFLTESSKYNYIEK